jgi:hypothetical protein
VSTKRCPTCGLVKARSEFWCSRSPRHPDGLQYSCKECSSARNIERLRKLQKQIRARLRKLKLTTGCSDCGYANDPGFLDWHHPNDDKTANVSGLVWQGSWPLVEAEIAKCVLLCKVCHQKRHPNGVRRAVTH